MLIFAVLNKKNITDICTAKVQKNYHSKRPKSQKILHQIILLIGRKRHEYLEKAKLTAKNQ